MNPKHRLFFGLFCLIAACVCACSSDGNKDSLDASSLTIINANIWTGDAAAPWKTSMTVINGKIVSMDDEQPRGKVIDAGGRLVVPGMWDGHCHPQSPYTLTSFGAPSLLNAQTVADVQNILRQYVEDNPEDKYPRLIGWSKAIIFADGSAPTRQMIDAVVPDKPIYLVAYNGHEHWANTRALEIAEALYSDPPGMKGDGFIERDANGVATGFLRETEYAATDGVLLRSVKKVKPYTFEERMAMQADLHNRLFTRLGVTSIWTKDGDFDVLDVYEGLLADGKLQVRATLDSMYTPYSNMDYIQKIRDRADSLAGSGLPKDFLRCDTIKVFIDLPQQDWIWMIEPYLGTSGQPTTGRPAFPMEDFVRQVETADALGLQVNVSVYGDMAARKTLDVFEEIARKTGHRDRRHTIEHGQYIANEDLPRYPGLGVLNSMNPLVSYPNMAFQNHLREYMGEERQDMIFQNYRRLLDAGVKVVNGSDFPLMPSDPLIGIHVLASGTDIEGNPPGGLWPHKLISVEEALHTYTTVPAYANFAEDRLGMLKVGYDADFVALSENILNPAFPKDRIAWVKVNLTVLNGQVLFEDFSDTPKDFDFLQ